MKQLEVTILGQSYILACPDGGEALLGAAVASVDREMSGIRDAGKVKARERIAVLAALNLAYQLADSAPRAGEVARRGTAASTEGEPDVDALIHRIDAALGDDGHLL
jgi:cell division protein ZapA